MGRLFVVCAAYALAFGSAEATEIVHKTEISHYQIDGQTPLELVREMNRKGEKAGDRVMLASIATEANYVMKFPSDSCARGRLHVNATFAVRLPAPRSRLPEATAKSFNIFYGFLKKHEETHRQINLQCMARVKDRTDRLLETMQSCSQRKAMRAKLAAIISAETERCRARHAALDRRDEPKVGRFALYRDANGQSEQSGKQAAAATSNRQAIAYRPAPNRAR